MSNKSKAAKMTPEEWRAFEAKLKKAVQGIEIVISSSSKKAEGRSHS